MAGVQHKSDRRDRSLHHGHWLLKAGLWALCNALPFFLPVGVVGAYSWLARFGSPLFLLIQMIILLVSRRWPAGRGVGAAGSSRPGGGSDGRRRQGAGWPLARPTLQREPQPLL